MGRRGRLQDKVAIVTGAAQGMGAATATRFAEEGAKVLVTDIDTEKGEATVAAIVAAGGTASFLRVDVAEESDIIAMIDTAVERYGALDVLHNHAGGSRPGKGEGPTGLERMSAAEWDRSQAINLRPAFLGIKYALPHMRKAGGGSIINTGSTAGLRGVKGIYDYNAFKAGVHMLTESFAQSAGVDNIRVNAIAPGFIASPSMLRNFPPGADNRILPLAQPIPRAGRPIDVANAAVFLASDEASFITGVVLRVDGGWIIQGDQNSKFTLHMASSDGPSWV